MKIKIDDKEHELHFGWAFLKYANKANGLEMDGLNTGVGGMTKLELGANMADPETLLIALKAGLASEKHQPSNRELESFIEQKIEEGTYHEFYDELWREVKKHPILKQAIRGKSKAADLKLI